MIKATDASLSNTPSFASLSTRVNSSCSVQELRLENAATSITDPIVDAEKCSPISKRFTRPRFKFALAIVIGFGYLWWSRYIMRTSKRANRWGPQWLARCAAAVLTGLGWFAGVRGVKDINTRPYLVPDRQVMLCMHPHGFAGIGPLTLLGNEPRRKNGKMENVFILAADVAFKVPVLRELFLFINARAANEAVIDDVFRGGGSVAVFPGGIHEQLRTDPNQEKVSFPPNIGFVRQAIKHGVPLIPLYNFGENQQFGRWGLRFMPRLYPFQSRFGRVVEVGRAESNPSDAHVRQVFLKYCAELRRVFDEFKDIALPLAVAARGLKIEWRGHETEDLSAINFENDDSDRHCGDEDLLVINSIVDAARKPARCEAPQSVHSVQTQCAELGGRSISRRSRM